MKNELTEYVVNPLVRIRWNKRQNNEILLENTEAQKKYVIENDILQWLAALVNKKSLPEMELELVKIKGCEKSDAQKLIKTMITNGILVDCKNRTKYENWIKKGWRNALFYHQLVRNTKYVDVGKDAVENKIKKIESYLSEEKPEHPIRIYKNVIALPPPTKSKKTLYDALFNRRTTRLFKSKKMTQADLSAILYYSMFPAKKIRESIISNSNDPQAYTKSRYTACEIFVLVNNVENIENGVYGYDLTKHGLSRVNDANPQTAQYVAIGQKPAATASVTFIITTRPGNYMWRYRYSRAYRKMLAETSAVGHRIILAGEAIGVKSFMTPALKDTAADKLLKIDGFNETATYLVSCGYPLTDNLNEQIMGRV